MICSGPILASLKLLQELLTDPAAHHILILGAFRDYEVEATHPLRRAVEEMRQAGARLEEIVLRPLELEHTVALTADSVRRPPEEVRALATLVYEKTGGNPFFVIQFFNELLRDGLLGFDAGAWRWSWDLDQIRQRGYTDNVAELMVTRLAGLPAETRELVQLAACVGNTIEPRTLAGIASDDEASIERRLLPAFEQGLLVLGQQSYRFAHDRVQQAAYSLIPETERPAIHWGVGRQLLKSTSTEEVDARLFEILNQLNRGVALITDPAERVVASRLNLRAGRKARNSAAPAAAVQYLRSAIELLGEDGWRTAYDIACPAHLLRAECEFLVGHPDEAFRALDAIEERGQSVLDRAPGRNLRTSFLTNQGKLVDASDYTVETARLLGMDLPSPHDRAALTRAVTESFEVYQAALQGRTPDSLADLPRIDTLRELALLDTVAAAIPAIFQWNIPLMQLIVLKAVLLAVPDRTAPAFFYVQYGLVHSLITGDHETAFRFGELAIRLSTRPEDLAGAGATHFVHAAFLAHFKRHIGTSLEHLRIALRLSLERGDLVHARYCWGLGTPYRMYAGESLDAIRDDLPEIEQALKRAGDVINLGFLTIMRQAISALKGETSSLSRFDDPSFSEAEFEAHALPPVLALYGPTKVMLRYLGGDFEGALEASEQVHAAAELVLQRLASLLSRARARAPRRRSAGEERARQLERLSEDVCFTAKLAENCPENHAHRDQLLRAELASLEGDGLRALPLYDMAAAQAREHGFLHEEALAYELAARAARAARLDTAADVYMNEACWAYRSWGAEGKARQLERLFPGAGRRHTSPNATFLGSHVALDMIAVVKASQAISGELNWKRVSQRLLEVALEQGGANYGCLLDKRDGDLEVAACAKVQAAVTSQADWDRRMRRRWPPRNRSRTSSCAVEHR